MGFHSSMMFVEGADLGDLPRAGFSTGSPMTGEDAHTSAGSDAVGVREVRGGLFLVDAGVALAEDEGRIAEAFGRRTVAVVLESTTDSYGLEVFEPTGLVRRRLDVEGRPSVEASGEPLPQEGSDALDEEATIALFVALTGVEGPIDPDAEFVELLEAGPR